jgi:general secretion pathway protein K
MRRQQQGVALITAILVVALATIAAAALLSDADVALRRAQTLQDSELAWWYAKGLDSWVASLLQRQANNGTQQPVDSLGDSWAQPVSFLPFEHGAGRGQLTDMQGLFNLNNLASGNATAYVTQLRRLIENVAGNSSAGVDLGNSIRQWLLPANATQAAGFAPTADYASMQPPYQAANQPMYSPSEVLAVAGMTPQIYEALAPYITAIPPSPVSTASAQTASTPQAAAAGAAAATVTATTLNVNTAPLAVLLSLSDHPDAGRMKAFVAERNETPARTAQEAIQRLGLSANDMPSGTLGVSSNYYLLHADIAVGTDQMALYSVILRPASGAPVVIARSTTTN